MITNSQYFACYYWDILHRTSPKHGENATKMHQIVRFEQQRPSVNSKQESKRSIYVKQQEIGFNKIERRLMDLNGLKRMDNQQEWSCSDQNNDTNQIFLDLQKKGKHCTQINKCRIPFLRRKNLPKRLRLYQNHGSTAHVQEENNLWKNIHYQINPVTYCTTIHQA